MEWEGKRIRTLSQADHRLFALAHGIQHEWCALHWLVDGAKILFSDASNHAELIRGIEKYGMEREFAVSRRVMELVFGMKTSGILSSVKPAFFNPEGPAEYCRDRLFSSKPPRLIDSFVKIARFDLPLAPGFHAKLRRLAEPWKVPAQDALRQRLPRSFYALHVALRPFNVMGRRISRLGQKIAAAFPSGEILGAWALLACADLRLRLMPYSLNRGFIFGASAEGDKGETIISEEDMAAIRHLSGVVKHAASHPFLFNMTCLRRSIVLKDLLVCKGIRARIVFGVQKKERSRDRIPGHAWLRVGDLDIDTYGANSGLAVFSTSPSIPAETRTHG
ncbi:MAG: hypothetical protein FD137_1604 [Spirochaetes bacterium]|nr:MAG: hypothetical protein FD137_1604 [Spirochaetota bacterium]